LTNSYLIDTNILVLAIRQRQNKWDLLRGLVVTGATLSCSVITLGEIYAGMRPHERVRTEELLSVLDSHPVTAELARLAGLIKNEWKTKGFILSLPDALIAATAIAHGLTLITDNRKDFPMPELAIYPLP
jgi:predicted nucleic acid-binding protein